MSRIGKQPISVPANVKVSVAERVVTVESGSNRLSMTHRPELTVRVDEDAKQVVVERGDDERMSRSLHGLTRSLIFNMVEGVTKGFSKELEIVGVGWTAKQQGNMLHLSVGYADTREVEVPAGVQIEINGPRIKISGIDKQAVGQLAAVVRSQRPPEPYNGKGIKYSDERIVRKQGKAFVGGAA
ncbi:MAG: 50S ribosomal protein L6 [Phycisphaeraceae bacterium]|nr:50S ribosomal protein L6 [Phycisphaeraceae bacterium]